MDREWTSQGPRRAILRSGQLSGPYDEVIGTEWSLDYRSRTIEKPDERVADSEHPARSGSRSSLLPCRRVPGLSTASYNVCLA